MGVDMTEWMRIAGAIKKCGGMVDRRTRRTTESLMPPVEVAGLVEEEGEEEDDEEEVVEEEEVEEEEVEEEEVEVEENPSENKELDPIVGVATAHVSKDPNSRRIGVFGTSGSTPSSTKASNMSILEEKQVRTV
jgi:hypothetical protein